MDATVPKQEEINVYLDADGEICIEQDHMGEPSKIWLSFNNVELLVDGLRRCVKESLDE